MFRKIPKLFENTPPGFHIIKEQTDIYQILKFYRYASWCFTSLFYMFTMPKAPVLFKLGVIISLFIAAKIIMGFYSKALHQQGQLAFAVLIESVGVALLLLPTGGLNSPFMWYALNPVLVAASFLPLFLCWLNLTFYLVLSVAISFLYFRQWSNIDRLLQDNAYLLLVFALITLLVQMFSLLTRQLNQQAAVLKDQSVKLQAANERLQGSMEHIMSLYQAVEAFHSQDSFEKLMETMAEYAAKLTGSPVGFFWRAPFEHQSDAIAMYEVERTDSRVKLEAELRSTWKTLYSDSSPSPLHIGETRYSVVCIRSSSRVYGLLGMEVPKQKDKNLQRNELLSFLAELSAIILERQHMEEVTGRFIILEEQNRIANEIHDSVSQRLFSIVCAIAAITGKQPVCTDGELSRQLELIRESAGQAMQELRASIYRLSSRKKGEKAFSDTLHAYMDEFSKLNDVDIHLDVKGDEDLLSSPVRKALYRIIREGAGNAVRHGKCQKVSIEIDISATRVTIWVRDDGNGFNLSDISRRKEPGIGLSNMKGLVQSLCGKLTIDSKMGYGTQIKIVLPFQRWNLNGKRWNLNGKGDIAL